ncbi:MAG: hypothetical protein C0624_02310 [Desulfuromonas sp.]|nr:MAG: hypothetical protein C0624_02310 [Desulfuromonas sp.]
MLELFGTLFSSIGEVHRVHTVVDYYTYIKGLEYLICVAFFVGFPLFYKFIHSPPADRTVGRHS